ncbi:YhaN family protein [Phenylobacterium sp.]|uniref:ATP-binding protein n=1 Tax=Phenylobacterium sp. TaxID=1871053 RepID=UPI002737FE2D|nr:YhaN family protein [Phenylobacterium sp.]MDP3870401.1 AAA family ATPase [Phenylobacterium sp.]
MRFRELQLLRYGRFEDCTLPFTAGASDLQLIFGPNEAGKSTTLEAVGDLLFGFSHAIRFAFRFDRQLLRVGAVIEDGDNAFEVRRKRGTAQTLLGPDDEPTDPTPLAAALGAQTRESFERMFGLDHVRLRAGGQAILDARDDVGRAIFAAGSGLVGIGQVCDELEAEAKAIWTARAGESRTYTAAARRHQDARGRLRDAQIRPAAWAEAKRALDGADNELIALRERRGEVERQARDLERRRRTLAPVARLRDAIRQLKALGETPDIPEGGPARFEAALRAREREALEIQRAQAMVIELVESLSAAQPDEVALEARDEIEALRETRGERDRSHTALPRLAAERETHLSRLRALQVEIGWPVESPEAVKARLPGRPLLAEIRDLLERRAGLDRQSETAETTLKETTADLARRREQLDALPATVDLQPLQSRLRGLRDAGDLASRVEAAQTLNEGLAGVVQDRLAALSPWTGSLEALRSLSMPAEEDVGRAIGRLDDARDEVSAERASTTRDLERLQQLRLERSRAALEHLAPGRDDLETTRRERDAAWEPLKAQLTGGPSVEAPAVSAEAYARQVADADRIADQRFDRAEHAGRLAGLDGEIAKADLNHHQSKARLDAAEEELRAAEAAFASLVATLRFPLSAEAYEGWRDARVSALEADDALAQAGRDLVEARNAEDHARSSLAVLLGQTSKARATLQSLFAEAEQRLDAAAAQQARRVAVEAQIETTLSAEQRAQIQARAIKETIAEWSAAWVSALERLSLPADSGLVGVRSRLELIETLRAELDDLLGVEAQVVSAQHAVSSFDAAVGVLAGRLGQALLADAGDTLAALAAAAATAASKAERARDLKARLAEAHEAQVQAQTALADAEADAAHFLALASDGDPKTVREVIGRAVEAGRLQNEVRTLEAEILTLGEGHALAALVEASAGADPDALADEARSLADTMAVLNGEVEGASAARQAADSAFKALDDRPDAAIAAFDMAETRSEMAFQAELYIRKRAEAKLLRASIDRYRAEKQGPLLARASQLFQTLTLRRYDRLLVEYDGGAPRLAGQRSDGASVVPVEGMSQGTVDQLFLALRVAAVEDAVAQGARLPFLADDLFINFDDARAAAGFQVLAGLAQQTQVLFFTHHEHLLDVARSALHPAKVASCNLPVEAAQAAAE